MTIRRDICEKCGGTGAVWQEEGGDRMPEQVTCPECGGAGEIEVEDETGYSP